jgi:hypothetical protein
MRRLEKNLPRMNTDLARIDAGLRLASASCEQIRLFHRRRFFSLMGEKKTVSSDGACAVRQPGPQAQFVQFTEDLDELVGSRKWTRCRGSDCSQ